MTGQPAISLPLFWNAAGLPIGVQLVAAYGREDLLLRVAAQLETRAPVGRAPPADARRRARSRLLPSFAVKIPSWVIAVARPR